jgi:DNA-binding MarR family transcriptional regulator
MSAPAPVPSAPTTPTAATPTKIQLLELLAAIGTAQWQDFAAAAARHGLTSMQAKVLAQLHGPVPMRGLAEALVCDASNITGIVDRLESHGFVRREVSPADRRVKNVVATDLGRETIRRVREEMQATHGALDTLDEDERTALHGLLERLRPVMEDRAHARTQDRHRT